MVDLLKQDKFTIEHAKDLIGQASKQNRVIHSDFLSLHEQAIILSNLDVHSRYEVHGGYKMAERKLFTFYPEHDLVEQSCPYTFLEIELPKVGVKRKPNHRDYLGALLNTGIDRRKIGDLLVFDDYAIVIAVTDIADFVIDNLVKIGSVSVNTNYVEDQSKWMGYEPSFEHIKTTVASNRLDNLIKSGTKLSRSGSGSYIKSGKVFVDGKEVTQISYEVNENSVISVRGIGKFRLTKVGDLSKKGRLYIELDVYR